MRSRGPRTRRKRVKPTINEKTFLEKAKRLSSMKLAAGERLYADTASSVAQRKTAIAAQVESLSQLTGLGDVEAAQKLLQVAGQLSQSPDPQLAHQGRLVLVGFRLNQLVEGQIKDPQVILDDVNAILDKSEFRGLVENCWLSSRAWACSLNSDIPSKPTRFSSASSKNSATRPTVSSPCVHG